MKESSRGPVEQMEAILADEALKLRAEQTRMHAEMILTTAMHDKPMMQGVLLYKATGQGLDYVTGVAMAIALTTRTWGRVLADDSDLDLGKYLEGDVNCDAPLAHELVLRALACQTVAETDLIREEMRRFAERHNLHQFGRIIVHFTYLCADLLIALLDVVEDRAARHLEDGTGDS